MAKKIGVILSGCGVQDGSEIHEAVLTLLAIDRAGAEYACFAPDVDQHHVTNHLTGEPTEEKRNVLVESARIARGAIRPLSEFKAEEHDALVLPGGFGAALNLSTFAVDGPTCTVNPDVEAAVKGMAAAGKPIGALCIAPVVLAKLLGEVEVTIGSNADVAGAIGKLGATHTNKGPGEIVVDSARKVVTTPCYMLESTISQIAEGAENVVKKIIEMS